MKYWGQTLDIFKLMEYNETKLKNEPLKITGYTCCLYKKGKEGELMASAKEQFGKGYADGRREAEYQKSHGALDQISRDLGYDSKKSDDAAYKGGFEQGVKDGKK